MGYVERSLLTGERVIRKAQLPKADWAGLIVLAGLGIIFIPLLGGFFILLMLIVIPVFLAMVIRRRNTEIAITSQRLILKQGWVSRKTDEVSLRRIEEINLEQGLFGRMLGFGKVQCRGVGGGGIDLPAIQNPVAFRKALQEAQMRIDSA